MLFSNKTQAYLYNVTATGNSADKGGVLYTNVGRASIGSPCVIKTKNGNWYIASHSQAYFKIDAEITTGIDKAQENELVNVNPAPALEVRELMWNKESWPMAAPEVFSGAKAWKRAHPR